MTKELIVPTLGESITEATVSKWFKKIGENFDIDDPLVEIETDKITVEVPAPRAGVLSEIKVQEGSDVNVGGVLAIIGEPQKSNSFESNVNNKNNQRKEDVPIKEKKEQKLSPAVKKIVEEKNLDSKKISSTRNDGRITKADVIII